MIKKQVWEGKKKTISRNRKVFGSDNNKDTLLQRDNINYTDNQMQRHEDRQTSIKDMNRK